MRRTVFVLGLTVGMSGVACAQHECGKVCVEEGIEGIAEVETPGEEPRLGHVCAPDEERAFAIVERQAEFPGGTGAMMKWIGEHLIYPHEALEKGVSGKVIVQALIESDGTVGEVSVVRGKDPSLDREAVRVVKKMPKWNPASMNGATVASYFTLPVIFKAQ